MLIKEIIQTKNIQDKFLQYLQILDKNIVRIEPQFIDDEQLLRVELENPKQSLISSELGDGTNRYIEILSVLLSCSQKMDASVGSVFIDEIENGIHYSKLKDFWKAIIEIVQKENIQLFVTTHDKESIDALIKASEELEYESITSIELFKKDNKILPIVMNYENLSFGFEIGMDVR
jgi:AAA15 family ATPase/GTPase